MPCYYNKAAEVFPNLLETEVIDAVANYVSEHSCYGTRAMREMTLSSIHSTPIYLYTLELSIEERSSTWVTEPYKGEHLEPPPNPFPMPIDIWTINVPPPVRFGDGRKVLEVPGTLSIVNCTKCAGLGSVACGKCAGTTLIGCPTCMATGFLSDPQDLERMLKTVEFFVITFLEYHSVAYHTYWS